MTNEELQQRIDAYTTKVNADDNKRPVRRSIAFEHKQLTQMDKNGIQVNTPKIKLSVWRSKQGIQTAVAKGLPFYGIRFGDVKLSFKTLDQMLLWLCRRLQTAQSQKVNGKTTHLVPYLEGIILKLEMLYVPH